MKHKSILILVCTVFLVIIGFRMVYVNERFKVTETKKYAINETIRLENVDVAVSDARFMEENDLQANLDYLGVNLDEAECLILDLKVKNTSDETVTFDSTFLTVGSGAWAQQMYLEVFMYLNGPEASLYPELAPDEEIVMQIPFPLTCNQFSSKAWQEVKERTYTLYISLYPVKRIVQLEL